MSDLTYREIEDSHELSHIEHEGDAGAPHAQHGPAPPRHARGAAAADHARGRGRARHRADDRLRPHRHREDRRGQGVLEGHPGRRADGLPRVLLQRDGVLRRGRDAARARGPAARPVPARAAPGAQPDHVPPGVARHQRARPRRDLDVLVLLPRPRADPRPVRDVDRPAHAHALHPGRRRDRGHPGRLRRARCASSPSRCPTRVDQYLGAAGEERDRAAAPARRRRASTSETLLDLGVTGPLLRASGNSWDLRKAAPYSSYEHFDFKIPVGTTGDN